MVPDNFEHNLPANLSDRGATSSIDPPTRLARDANDNHPDDRISALAKTHARTHALWAAHCNGCRGFARAAVVPARSHLGPRRQPQGGKGDLQPHRFSRHPRRARGQREYDFNLRLAKLMEQKLRATGFEKTTLLITQGKSRKGLGARVAKANKSSADLFLSIHHDSVPDRFLEKWQFAGEERKFSDRFKGHSIFVSHNNSDFSGSLLFGRLLGTQMKARGLRYTPHYTEKFMGLRQRQLVDADAGVYRYDQLIVLKNTRMPAVLLEAGSIINRDEELLMESPERQSLISVAATDAIDQFCAARRPRSPDRIARQPGVASGSRSIIAPAALAPASSAKAR
jgi:N-acetylmuramoyl-L-alanine amidase